MPRLVAIGPEGTPYEALGSKYLKLHMPLRGSESPSTAIDRGITRPVVGAILGAGMAALTAKSNPQRVALGAATGALVALLT